MTKLSRKDGMSVLSLDVAMDKAHWSKNLPKKYEPAIETRSKWGVFLALMYVEAEGIKHPSLDFYVEHTGYTRQTISMIMNAFVALGWVETGAYNNDKRNKLFYLNDAATRELAPLVLKSLLNSIHAFETYLNTNVTANVLKKFVQRPLTRGESAALGHYHNMRVEWFTNTNKK